MEPLLKYFPVIKVDDSTHTVWGIVTSETPDSDKEICDYAFAKAAIQKWSDEALAKTTAAGQDPSLGNMRVMHQLEIGGKAVKIEYKDAEKQIWVGSEPANDEVWHLLKGGFLTAHSIGGSYAWRKPEGEYERYGPTINEISYVDRGANPDASFSYVKADGTTELRKFAKPGPEEEKILQKMKAADIAKLSDEDIDKITKAVVASFQGDSELDTHDAIFQAFERWNMRKLSAAKEQSPMKLTDEQIKKCADALGVTVEEFTKADILEKAKHGIAALHSHMETAMAHHDGMMKAHEAMGSMHEKMSAHLGKCMKACKAVMGDDEKEADKAIKALVDEMTKSAETPEAKAAREAAEKAAANGTLTKAELDKVIAAAVEKAIGELPEKSNLRIVPRDSSELVKAGARDGSPFGV